MLNDSDFDLTLLKKLINIDSTTGKEKEIAFFLHDYLKDLGLNVELQKLNESQYNVFASKGNPDIIFTSHLDTVEPFIKYCIKKNIVYGRGACDAKSSIFVQIMAVKKIIEEGLSNFGLLFVSGEEVNSIGAKQALKLNISCKYLVNGEPTDNCLADSSRGILHILMEFKGRSYHSAIYSNPHIVEVFINTLNIILKEFPNKEYLTNVGVIKGGTAHNIAPASIKCEILFRILNNPSELIYKLKSYIPPTVDLKIISYTQPFNYYIVPGFKSKVVDFGTDSTILSNNCKSMLLGPGSIRYAHSKNEQITLEELKTGIKLYVDIFKTLRLEIENNSNL